MLCDSGAVACVVTFASIVLIQLYCCHYAAVIELLLSLVLLPVPFMCFAIVQM